MRPSRLATLFLLGSMITFNAPCGRLDLGGDRAHGADASSAPFPLAAQGGATEQPSKEELSAGRLPRRSQRTVMGVRRDQ